MYTRPLQGVSEKDLRSIIMGGLTRGIPRSSGIFCSEVEDYRNCKDILLCTTGEGLSYRSTPSSQEKRLSLCLGFHLSAYPQREKDPEYRHYLLALDQRSCPFGPASPWSGPSGQRLPQAHSLVMMGAVERVCRIDWQSAIFRRRNVREGYRKVPSPSLSLVCEAEE